MIFKKGKERLFSFCTREKSIFSFLDLYLLCPTTTKVQVQRSRCLFCEEEKPAPNVMGCEGRGPHLACYGIPALSTALGTDWASGTRLCCEPVKWKELMEPVRRPR